jgi:hypothetical protein
MFLKWSATASFGAKRDNANRLSCRVTTSPLLLLLLLPACTKAAPLEASSSKLLSEN